MVSTFTQKFTVSTTPDLFQFTFYCDQCGKPWNSRPIPYQKNYSNTEVQSCDRESSYQYAFQIAFTEAKKEGLFCFNRCERCGFWVCNEHFSIKDNLCLNCMEKGA